MKLILATGMALFAIGALGLGWIIARKLTAPVGPRNFDLVVRDIETVGAERMLVLDSTPQTLAEGIYNLWFENDGWVQVTDEVYDRGPKKVARAITNVARGSMPTVGDRFSWSGIYFASPSDANLNAVEVLINTPAGAAPAWIVEGSEDCSIWAIHIHGLGSDRAGTLRGAQVAAEQGYTSLVISYRNDGEGPKVGAGRSTLGLTEAEDATAAVAYAIKHGAEKVVLFGWSMGALIALQVADRARHNDTIAGLVLDAPVLDWSKVIKANCVRKRLPGEVGNLVYPWLTVGPLARIVGIPGAISLRHLNWIIRAGELNTPTLIMHGTRDDSTPIEVSETLRAWRPDIVDLSTFSAGHALAWNTEPERWRTTVKSWLTDHITND